MKPDNLRYYIDLLRGKDQHTCGNAINNILHTMSATRHTHVCGEDFSQIDFGFFPLTGYDFSYEGKYQSKFDNAKICKYNFIHGHEERCRDVFFVFDSKKDKEYVMTYTSHEIIVWDYYSGAAVDIIKLENEYINTVNVSGNGNIFLYSTDEDNCYCKSLNDLRENIASNSFSSSIWGSALSTTGKFAAILVCSYMQSISSYQLVLQVFEVNNGKFDLLCKSKIALYDEKDPFHHFDIGSTHIVFSDDSQFVAVSLSLFLKVGHIFVVDFQKNENVSGTHIGTYYGLKIKALYFSSDNKYILYDDYRNIILQSLIDESDKVTFENASAENNPFSFVVGSAVILKGNELISYNIKRRATKVICKLPVDKVDIKKISISRDFKKLIIIRSNGQFYLFNIESNELDEIENIGISFAIYILWNRKGNKYLISDSLKVCVRNSLYRRITHDFFITNLFDIHDIVLDSERMRLSLMPFNGTFLSLKDYLKNILTYNLINRTIDIDQINYEQETDMAIRNLSDTKKRRINSANMKKSALLLEKIELFSDEKTTEKYYRLMYTGDSTRDEVFRLPEEVKRYIRWSNDGAIQIEFLNDQLILRETDTLSLIKIIQIDNNDEIFHSVAISDDKSLIALITDTRCYVIKVNEKEPLLFRTTSYVEVDCCSHHVLNLCDNHINDVCFSQDSQYCVIADTMGSYYLWDYCECKFTQIIKFINIRNAHQVYLFDYGKYVIYNMGKYIIIINVETKEDCKVYNVPGVHVSKCSFCGCKLDDMTHRILEQYNAKLFE